MARKKEHSIASLKIWIGVCTCLIGLMNFYHLYATGPSFVEGELKVDN